MKSNQPRANLLKVNKSEYIIDMYENEYLYLSQHKSFRGPDFENNGIMDPREQNVTTFHGKNVTITGKDGKSLIPNNLVFLNGELNESIDDEQTLICPFYYLENDLDEPTKLYQEQFYKPQNHMFVIFDLIEFRDKFRESMDRLNLGYLNKPVEYYEPKTWNGSRDSLDVHHKDIAFSFQCEFRIAVRPLNYGEPGLPPLLPMKVPLPGLRKISYIKRIYPLHQ